MAVFRPHPAHHRNQMHLRSICELQRIDYPDPRIHTRSDWHQYISHHRSSHSTNLPHPQVVPSLWKVDPP